MALRGLRRGSAAARFLGLRVRIPPGKWKSLSCECCALSGRGLCLGLITRPEESYRAWCVLWAWSRSPVRGGQDPESDRRATGKRSNVFICQHVAPTTLVLTESTNKRKLIFFTWTRDYFAVTTNLQMKSFGIFQCYKLCSFCEGISCGCGFCLTLFHCPGSINNQSLDARCSVDKISLISG
jgi:hypothetical protein